MIITAIIIVLFILIMTGYGAKDDGKRTETMETSKFISDSLRDKRIKNQYYYDKKRGLR